jgi:hypothetical protein
MKRPEDKRFDEDAVGAALQSSALVVDQLYAAKARIAELEDALLSAESALFNAASSAGVQAEALKEAALAAYKARDKRGADRARQQ